MEKKKKGRRKSRCEMVEILYQYELFDEKINANKIFEEFEIDEWQFNILKFAEKCYELNKKIIISNLDEGRTWESVLPLDRSILLIGAIEINMIDKKIVLNEYIEISKRYSPGNSYKFINNILERVFEVYENIKRRDQKEQE